MLNKKHVTLILAALTVALTQQTASADVLSDNLNQSDTGTEPVSSLRWITSSFGTDARNYVLDSVTLRINNRAGAPAVLDLYSDSSGHPGSLLGSLVSPSSYPAGEAEVTFGGNSLPLSANTTYWEVLRTTSGELDWYWTISDAGSGVGFQHTWGLSNDAGLTWTTFTTQPMLMQVVATSPIPDGGSSLALLGGSLALIAAVGRKFRK